MTTFLFLAQSPTTQPAPTGGFMLWFPLVLMGVLWYFILVRPRRAEQQKFQEMLKAIKKNDRVMTIGGIIGVVSSVKDDEIILKVDESTNTRLTFTRSAIKSVVSAAPAGDEKKPL